MISHVSRVSPPRAPSAGPSNPGLGRHLERSETGYEVFEKIRNCGEAIRKDINGSFPDRCVASQPLVFIFETKDNKGQQAELPQSDRELLYRVDSGSRPTSSLLPLRVGSSHWPKNGLESDCRPFCAAQQQTQAAVASPRTLLILLPLYTLNGHHKILSCYGPN